MKQLLQKAVYLYNTNPKVHSFVFAVESGLASGVPLALSGGIPQSKQALYIAGAIVLGAVWGRVKFWAKQNLVAPTSTTGAQG